MIPILYEDRAVLVCIKPSGVLSESTIAGLPGLPELLKEQVGGEIFPVHRLDRDTGGVMVYARNRVAAGSLSSAIQERKLQKTYLAVVMGCPQAPAGSFRDLLLHDRQRNKSFVVDRQRGGVKEALLDYRVVSAAGGRSLMEVQLHTGRTHQIRVQFASRKMPLVGDRKYGGCAGELALWSAGLSFPHPTTGKIMTFRQLPQGEPWSDFAPWGEESTGEK